MVVQHNLALRRTVPHFIDWTIRHRSRENLFLAWHCGNGPTCLRAPDGAVTLRSRRRPLDAPIPEDDRGAGVWEFVLRPGPVTLSRLVEYGGRFSMLMTRGEIVDDPDRERGTSAWVAVPDLERLYATLVDRGFIHHASMVHGDHAASLAAFCRFAGIEAVVV
jgi:L-fucose isomerase-like protein